MRGVRLVVAIITAAGILWSCGGDDGAAGEGESDRTTTTTNEENEALSRSPIPFEVGNRWTYRIEYAEPVGTVIYEQEVTDLAPGEHGTDVTVDTSYHFENGSQPDFAFDVLYTVQPDGALSAPLNAFAIYDVDFVRQGTGGTVVWPSLQGIRDGERKMGDFTATITSPELGEIQADYHYDITGAGTSGIDVEAGSFPEAALMNVTFDITTHVALGPYTYRVTGQLWFAEGVGLVLHQTQGGVQPGQATELIDTNVGR